MKLKPSTKKFTIEVLAFVGATYIAVTVLKYTWLAIAGLMFIWYGLTHGGF